MSYIRDFTVITFPCPSLRWTMAVKEAQGVLITFPRQGLSCMNFIYHSQYLHVETGHRIHDSIYFSIIFRKKIIYCVVSCSQSIIWDERCSLLRIHFDFKFFLWPSIGCFILEVFHIFCPNWVLSANGVSLFCSITLENDIQWGGITYKNCCENQC